MKLKKNIKYICLALLLGVCMSTFFGLTDNYHRDGSTSPAIDLNALPLHIFDELCLIWMPLCSFALYIEEVQKWKKSKRENKPHMKKSYFLLALLMFSILMSAYVCYVLFYGFWMVDEQGRLIFDYFLSWRTDLSKFIVFGLKIVILSLSFMYLVQIKNDPEVK